MRIKLGIHLSVKEVASAINGAVRDIDEQTLFSHLTTDSREVCHGDLFVALKGEKFNGENYLREVTEKGAIPITTKNVNHAITVRNTQEALFALAKYYKTLLKNLYHTIAITGSVGKTTTKEFTKTLLENHFITHASSGNFNNKIGLPLAMLSAPKNTEILILEMGMNHIGEISELSKCACPTISVITNIGSAHIGNLGSRDMISKAKLEILDGMAADGVLIIPYDEPLLSHQKNALKFSSKSTYSDVYIIYNEGKCVLGNENNEIETSIGYCAPHLLECIAAAVAICLKAGLTLFEIKRYFSLISDKNIRQTVFFVNKTAILADYYNAAPESVISAIDYLFSHKQYEHKSALLGDILELGDMSESIHYMIGKKCAEYNLRTLYLFGKYSEFTEAGAVSGGFGYERIFKNTSLSTPEITAMQIYNNTVEREIILFKASHAIDLGRVVSLLKNMHGKE